MRFKVFFGRYLSVVDFLRFARFENFRAGTSPARSFRSFIIQGAGISGFGEID
jgi:hypothetical protein